MSSQPGPVDYPRIVQMCEQLGADVMSNLLQEFARQAGSMADEICAAIDSADWPTAHRMAHSLKGSSGTLGMDALSQQAVTALGSQGTAPGTPFVPGIPSGLLATPAAPAPALPGSTDAAAPQFYFVDAVALPSGFVTPAKPHPHGQAASTPLADRKSVV